MNEQSRTMNRRRWLQLATAGVVLANGGCSLFVMAGKMILGNPVLPADFTAYTKIDLVKADEVSAVICTTPEGIRGDFPSLGVDLLAEISRRLKVENIKVADPHLVAKWVDDNNGELGDFSDLAQTVDADIVNHTQIDTFAYKEENSPNLFRGRCSGAVMVWQVPTGEGKKKDVVMPAKQIYSKAFNSIYPVHQPVSVDQMTATVFRRKYLTRVSEEICRLFYPHPSGVEY